MTPQPKTPGSVTGAAMDARLTGLAIAALCSGLVIMAYPAQLFFPFVPWSVAGAVVLCSFAMVRPHLRRDLVELAAWQFFVVILTAIPLYATVIFCPRTIDSSLNIDFGVSKGFVDWAMAHRPYARILLTVYNMLPFVAAFIIGSSAVPMRTGRLLLLAGVMAVPLYIAFPATGPAFSGMRYEPRNAMPSLHMTWAVLLVYFSRSKLRLFSVPFAVLTAVSTLTTGQHYLVDLLAAIPYACFFVWLARPDSDGHFAAAIPISDTSEIPVLTT